MSSLPAITQYVQGWSAPAAELMTGWVWKSVVLVVCVAALLRAVPRLSAAYRSFIWTGVLLVLLLLPVVSRGTEAVRALPNRGLLQAGPVWSEILLAAWAVLSIWRLLQLGGSALRLRSIARRAVPVSPPPRETLLLARGPRGGVTLCVSPDVSRPGVVGFRKPRILLPPGLLDELSGPELRHVMLHELEHLRRGDDWVNLLQKLCVALFPLHPALLWLDRRLCLERELACDDRVLRVTHARKAYAACLARLAENTAARRSVSLALGLLGVRTRASELSGRVHRILQSPAECLGRLQTGFVSALVLATLAGGSVVLAHSPRLISFAPQASSASPVEARNGLPASRLHATGTAREIAVAHREAMRPVAAAFTRPAAPRRAAALQTAVARPARRAQTLAGFKRATAPETIAPPPSTYFLLTTWQRQTMMPRLTFAIATDGREASQHTYAAVPVRDGWLLIQL